MIADKHSHIEDDPHFKGLNVQRGIERPEPVSHESTQRFLTRKKGLHTVDEFVEGILQGNITILSKAVTLIESSRADHQDIARQIIDKCIPYSGKSIRIGITGVPGAGKSTFIESIGLFVVNQGHKLAVLAIDPSSERTKGSILGDKTRMEQLSIDPRVYIRPSPSAGSLGGVARKTRETIVLCEAAGYDTVFIETVGVGQSETAVHSMVDFFLLLMLAGAGDELQGIKRGIMEMADAIVINKADGNNVQKAQLAKAQYTSALHLFPASKSMWTPKVKTCSSLYNQGMDEIWQMLNEYIQLTTANNFFNQRRLEQASFWMHETIQNTLKANFFQHPQIKSAIDHYEKEVVNSRMSSFAAANELLDIYFKNIHYK